MLRHLLPAALLLTLSLSLAACGYCGTEKLVEEARSSKVIAANEISEAQTKAMEKAGIPVEDEKVVWYYDHSVTSRGSEANILTTKRILHLKDTKVTEAPIDQIKKAKIEIGGSSDTIDLETKDGSIIVLRFGKFGDADKMFKTLCERAEGACGE